MPFKGSNDFFVVGESCDSGPILRHPALSLLIIIIFLCLKKNWVIWIIQMFTKTECKHPSYRRLSTELNRTKAVFPPRFSMKSQTCPWTKDKPVTSLGSSVLGQLVEFHDFARTW